MKGKAKKAKLKFRPTPISRLSKYKTPIKMVGDPGWYGYGRDGWANRERIVYDYEMERKGWPMAWKPEVYNLAWDDNSYIDDLLRHKWDHYKLALGHNETFDWLAMYANAERDNAAWDYHKENYLEEAS